MNLAPEMEKEFDRILAALFDKKQPEANISTCIRNAMIAALRLAELECEKVANASYSTIEESRGADACFQAIRQLRGLK